MQTKSYRLLKWTLLACVSASLAQACVVTTGDGGDDFFDGGEGGTNANTAGTTTNTGGGGKASTAGSGGKATGGGGASTTAGTGSAGTAASDYMAGLCDADAPDQESGPTPTKLADTTLLPKDDLPERVCVKCLKTECATEWSTCYGKAPTIACGFGPTEAESDGQFDCILSCFDDAAQDPMDDAEVIVRNCVAECTRQCDAADNGNPMVHTSDLVACANDPMKCQAECFSL